MLASKTVERALMNAFYQSVIDYRNNLVELEEDFRASLYHHLRSIVDTKATLSILLSHNVGFTEEILKPDICLFKKNTYYLCAELKIARLSGGKVTDINKESAKEDVQKLKSFKSKIECGYTIRIENSASNNILKGKARQDWHIDYLRDLFYCIEDNSFYFYAVKSDKIGGYVNIPFDECANDNLATQIENYFRWNYGIPLF